METLWSGSGGALVSVLLLVMIGLAGCTSSSPSFGDPTFAEDVQDGEPVGASSTFPVGTEKIHAFVDLQNVDADATLRQRWLHDGEAIFNETFQAREVADIESGESGTVSGNIFPSVTLQGGWPPGEYRFELLHDAEVVSEGTFTVGGGDDVFGPVYFGEGLDGGNMQGMASSFDTGIFSVMGAVRAPSLAASDTVDVRVTVHGVTISTDSGSVTSYQPVSHPVAPLGYSVRRQGGLPPGHYNMTFRGPTGEEATGSFVVGDGKGVSPILFGNGTEGTRLTGVASSFSSDVGTVYAGYDVAGHPADTRVREVWEHDNQTIASRNFTLGEASDRDPYQPLVIQNTPLSSQSFSTGTHYFGVYLDGTLERVGSFEIAS